MRRICFAMATVATALAAAVSSSNAADCAAFAHLAWVKGVTAESMSQGPTCANAVVTLVLRDSNGKPLWVDSRIGAQVMLFADVADLKKMNGVLKDWIDQSHSQLASTDKLPDWPRGAAAPSAGASGEFPFYPESDVDREAYIKLRAGKLPMFCYVQGMESLACVALTPDGVTKVGLQTFPG